MPSGHGKSLDLQSERLRFESHPATYGRPLTFGKLLSQFPSLRPSSHHSKMGVLTLCGVTRIGNNMCIACGPEKVHDNLMH